MMNPPILDYKALYNAAPCGYFCTTSRGDIIELNETLLEFTNYEREDVVNKKQFRDFLTPGGKIFLETHFLPLLQFQGYVQEINFEFLRQDGTTFPVLVNAKIIKDDSGNYNFTLYTIVNISQRKGYEKELLKAKRDADDLTEKLSKSYQDLKLNAKLIQEQKSELESLNKYLKNKNSQLSDFAHIISHNLRSPVFNLHMLLDFYRESTEEEEKSMYINTIKQVAVQMDETLNELIDSLKIQEEFLITKEQLSFEDILEKITIMLTGDIKKTEAQITHDFSEVKTIVYSKVYLKSAMFNLLTNAIKYKAAHRAPKIHFKTFNAGDKIVLTVEDNGKGIDMKKHKNDLFGLNKTFHNNPDAKGMGLYMTKVQIEALGGKITADSEVNQGTTFKIVFRKNL